MGVKRDAAHCMWLCVRCSISMVRETSPADEAAGDKEDTGVWRHHGVHAASSCDGQQLVDDERAGECHQY